VCFVLDLGDLDQLVSAPTDLSDNKDHKTSSVVDRNNNSLGLFSRKYQDSRSVGRQLLLRVPGVLDRRKGVGHLGSHITNVTAQWRGLEHLDQPDPLLWEIWENPIRFMQRSTTTMQSTSRLCSRCQKQSLTRPLVF
jgi:hypothetical protein